MTPTALTLLGALSTITGGVYFYWRAADRRLKPIDEHADWFTKHYEGSEVHEDIVTGTITSIKCYPPNTLWGKIKRYCLFDAGRIKATILLQPGMANQAWDVLADAVDDEDGVTVQGYDDAPRTKGSYITLEINEFDSEKLEHVIGIPVKIVDEEAKKELEERGGNIEVNVEYL